VKPDSVAAYIAALDPARAAICERLTNNIEAALPQAQGKLWHAIPVWTIGENVVVGFTARKTGVMLMFWNGQHFVEPGLEASGSFHMGQIPYLDVSEIDELKLGRWLAEAATSIWDMVGERNAFVAKRRAAKTKSKAKAKAKAKPAKRKVAAKPRKKPAGKATAIKKKRPAKRK
jgi:hypothetical protein